MPAFRCAPFGIGFCILFAFIGTCTYVNFVLVHEPLSLGRMALGLVYFVFLPSVITTPFAGRAVQRFGTRPAVWVSLALATTLAIRLKRRPQMGRCTAVARILQRCDRECRIEIVLFSYAGEG